MNPKKPVTNLTDLLINADVERLLTVNGFSLKGSDYDRFQRLCICLDRFPSLPLAVSLREAYERFFSGEPPMEARFCKEIWRRTSDLILQGETDAHSLTDIVGIRGEALPPVVDFDERDAFLLNGMQISTVSWTEWKAQAIEMADVQISRGKTLSVVLPRTYRFQKPNLYRVERFLSEKGENEDLWLSQLLYFLCEIGYQKHHRIAILGASDFDELRNSLQYVSRFTRLPRLFLQCKALEPDSLIDLCELISEEQGKEEGVPPILLI